MGRNMDRWLGDGGMPLIETLGAAFDGYGGDNDGAWCSATWTPTDLACNPGGIVQAGAHSVLLDASMNFAINAGLSGKDRARATIEMKTETMRAVRSGDALTARGEVVRMAKQVAYAEATIRGRDGQLVSRSTGTFLLHRDAGG